MLDAIAIFSLFFCVCLVVAVVVFLCVNHKEVRDLIALRKRAVGSWAEKYSVHSYDRHRRISVNSHFYKVNLKGADKKVNYGPMVVSYSRQRVSYAKEIFDRAGAFLVLMIIMPTFLVVALAIKISSKGPVFFRQPRRGMGGKVFYAYKFRTMYVGRSLAVESEGKLDGRVTRLGRFLRKYSLDELPQLFNVMAGDMSLVGPRPYRLDEDDLYISTVSGYAARYSVKPGMTGWAQVYGQGAAHKIYEAESQTKLDMKYVQLHSVWLDVKILICLFVPVLRSRLLNW
ncbi:sugar transferase [Pseudomonas sp. SCA2728.1_7]|uniref:sugar transferase n=1 Tax=Pseudomonas sp. SCA2728.1_7 TaxID=2825975 RepID=UPI001BAEAC58|nr:sugar transferase [Pseudomonas sp. SCA2728.1_7]QUE89686.1 sugar transferase [Pseudomonas sp. SCA2728.1_7]